MLRADLIDPKDSLMTFRQKSWDAFEAIGAPEPKQESFQYLSKAPQFLEPAVRTTVFQESKANLVFVDGFLEKAEVPKSLVCSPLNSAMLSYGLFLQSRMK